MGRPLLGETDIWKSYCLEESILREVNIWKIWYLGKQIRLGETDIWGKLYLEKQTFEDTIIEEKYIWRNKNREKQVFEKLYLGKTNIWRKKCLKKPCIGYLKKLIFGETNIWWNKYLEKHINVETNILVVSYFWSPDSGVIQISSCWPLYHLVGLLQGLTLKFSGGLWKF